MGLFNRKKKPWEYDNEYDMMISIMEDYSGDKKVLKKIIKEYPNYDLKATALINYLPRGQYISAVQMMDVLINEIGLSKEEAMRLIETYSTHVENIQKQMK